MQAWRAGYFGEDSSPLAHRLGHPSLRPCPAGSARRDRPIAGRSARPPMVSAKTIPLRAPGWRPRPSGRSVPRPRRSSSLRTSCFSNKSDDGSPRRTPQLSRVTLVGVKSSEVEGASVNSSAIARPRPTRISSITRSASWGSIAAADARRPSPRTANTSCCQRHQRLVCLVISVGWTRAIKRLNGLLGRV